MIVNTSTVVCVCVTYRLAASEISPESSISFNATETKRQLHQEMTTKDRKRSEKKYAVTEKILLPIFHLFGFRLIGFSVYYYYRFMQFSFSRSL